MKSLASMRQPFGTGISFIIICSHFLFCRFTFALSLFFCFSLALLSHSLHLLTSLSFIFFFLNLIVSPPLCCFGLVLGKGESTRILAWIPLVQCHTSSYRQACGVMPGDGGSDSFIMACTYESNKCLASVNALMWTINNEKDS